MMYQLYQAQADLLFPLRQFARMGASLARLADCGTCMPSPVRHISAGLTMFAEMGLTHHRPQFGIDVVTVNNDTVAVAEEAVSYSAKISTTYRSSGRPRKRIRGCCSSAVTIWR